MGKRKTPEEKAAEERRYLLARGASHDAQFERFYTDPNQAIRAEAARNEYASAEVLARFADDPFWGTRLEVVEHPNTSRQTLLGMLEETPGKRGVVHGAARDRLQREGVEFGDDGMPVADR